MRTWRYIKLSLRFHFVANDMLAGQQGQQVSDIGTPIVITLKRDHPADPTKVAWSPSCSSKEV